MLSFVQRSSLASQTKVLSPALCLNLTFEFRVVRTSKVSRWREDRFRAIPTPPWRPLLMSFENLAHVVVWRLLLLWPGLVLAVLLGGLAASVPLCFDVLEGITVWFFHGEHCIEFAQLGLQTVPQGKLHFISHCGSEVQGVHTAHSLALCLMDWLNCKVSSTASRAIQHHGMLKSGQ